MLHYVYCVRDKKLQAFDTPSFSREDKEHYIEGCVRGLKRIPDSQRGIAKDMALYFLGQYDDRVGKFISCEPEKLLDYEDYLVKEGDDHVGEDKK